MNKSITHVFMELIKRAEAGAKEIYYSLEKEAMVSPEPIDVTNYITKLEKTIKTKTWQHTITHQLEDHALNPFSVEDFL